MLKLHRLGIALQPADPQPYTVAKFNAGMTLAGDVVHMVYRYAEWRAEFDPASQSNYAVDETRYARLTPTGAVIFDSQRPLLAPSEPWDVSGCQDARVIPFEGTYYLIYCGWDKDAAPAGQDRARVGIARTDDFITAEKLGCVEHYTWDKDAFIFPERIGGKIAFVHRISPNIQIDYFDSFAELLDPRAWADYAERVEAATVLRAAFPWECGKVGGSVPPILTDDGWLFIYHAVETFPDRPFIYRAGAALLDARNPSRVIARLPYPILEPEADYELYGDVGNVVFPVGGYVYDGDLYISYGGADRCVALAKTPLAELLAELRRHPAW
jgi:predicted GH43/DUF377 family glycosyl hydrolase